MYNRKLAAASRLDLDSVHNYYEALVYEHLLAMSQDKSFNDELIADMACVALNRLPPRYIRYDVDMAFYLSPEEYEEIDRKVISATTEAIAFVLDREKENHKD